MQKYMETMSVYLTINGADSPEKDKKAGQFPET